jgi:hypothetical protein
MSGYYSSPVSLQLRTTIRGGEGGVSLAKSRKVSGANLPLGARRFRLIIAMLVDKRLRWIGSTTIEKGPHHES